MSNTEALQPLPEPVGAVMPEDGSRYLDCYTADQMRAYAALVRAQALEDAARMCASIAAVVDASAMGVSRVAGVNTANSCAAAIRALASDPAHQSEAQSAP